MRYAAGFFLLSILFSMVGAALAGRGAAGAVLSAPFFWGAAAQFITGCIYFAGSAFHINAGRWFKTREGRVRWMLWPVIWPYLFFEYRVWRRYRRRSRENRFDRVAEGLYLGSRPIDEDCRGLKEAGIKSVLDLVAELPAPAEVCVPPACGGEFSYLCVPTFDGTAPTVAELREGAEWINRERREGRPVLVHCTFGHGRSAAMAAAALMASGEAAQAAANGETEAEAAIKIVRATGRRIFLTPEQKRALESLNIKLRE